MELQTSCTNIVSRCVDSTAPYCMLASTLDYDKWSSRMETKRLFRFHLWMKERNFFGRNQISLASYTNSETHRDYLENIERSAMYPQHCRCRSQTLSFYWKIARDPWCGIDISYSLSQRVWILMRCIYKVCLLVYHEDIQEEFYHTIPGLEKMLKLSGPAYAIEQWLCWSNNSEA